MRERSLSDETSERVAASAPRTRWRSDTARLTRTVGLLAGLGALALLALGLRTRWLAWPLAGDPGQARAAQTSGAG